MTFHRICLGTAEDKFFCDHYLDYGNGQEKFDIDAPASSQHRAKHYAADSEQVDLLEELSYVPKHLRESNAQQDVHGEARYLISHIGTQSFHFSTGKPHRTSKDRRFIPLPEVTLEQHRVHGSGGKGAQHRKSERLLNQ